MKTRHAKGAFSTPYRAFLRVYPYILCRTYFPAKTAFLAVIIYSESFFGRQRELCYCPHQAAFDIPFAGITSLNHSGTSLANRLGNLGDFRLRSPEPLVLNRLRVHHNISRHIDGESDRHYQVTPFKQTFHRMKRMSRYGIACGNGKDIGLALAIYGTDKIADNLRDR
jgi:hypothetical protein